MSTTIRARMTVAAAGTRKRRTLRARSASWRRLALLSSSDRLEIKSRVRMTKKIMVASAYILGVTVFLVME